MQPATDVAWECYGGPKDGEVVTLPLDRRAYRACVPWRVGFAMYAALTPDEVERGRLRWMGWF